MPEQITPSIVDKLNNSFDFSPLQLKGLLIWGIGLVIAATILTIRHYSDQERANDRPPMTPLPAGEIYTGSFVLDPNTAPLDSLELLPGIGTMLAERIDAYRREKPFQTESELIHVNGIGPKMYERMRPYLKIRK